MADDWLWVRMAIGMGLALAAGFAVARAHLTALAVNVRLYLSPGAVWRPICLHLARLAVVVVSFTIAAMFGAPALIATLAGFTLGRALILRQHL